MKKMNRFTTIVSKCLEILHWIGAAGMLILMIGVLVKPQALESLATLPNSMDAGGNIAVKGFELYILDSAGKLNVPAVVMVAVCGMITMSLSAMVFRNIYLIFQTMQEKTSFSKGETPFQEDIIRMVREIGIFFISIPVVELIMSIIARLVSGAAAVESYVNFESVIAGIVVLCLAQVFAYGTKLEKEVDGLL